MFYRPAQGNDDRGQRVRIYDWGYFSWLSPRTRAAIARVNSASGLNRAFGGYGAVVGLALVLVSAVITQMLGPANSWVHFGLMMAVALVVGQIGGWYMRRRMGEMAPQIVTAALAEALCPTCGYGLSGLAQAADGCVQCPECGSAWRSERVQGSGACPDGGRERGASWVEFLVGTPAAADDRARGTLIASTRELGRVRPVNQGHAQRLARARRAGRRLGRPLRCVAGGVLIVVGMTGALPVVLVLGASQQGAGLAVSVVVTTCLGIWVLTSNVGQRPDTLIALYKRERLCPSCGGDLTGVPADTDGCILCPGCAAAWRLAGQARCGRCDYVLEGLEASEGGQIRCPECGAHT